MQVMLIRHSKTAGNAQRRYIGRTDEPLSAEGIALAETVGQDLTLQKVYVTPLLSSMEKPARYSGRILCATGHLRRMTRYESTNSCATACMPE